ncbi:MAG: tetratricopeptide repeat protein [Myxococcota bacterium]
MARQPKRMSRKELRQPDEVQVALKGLWDWIEEHWKLLVAAAGGLILIGVASTVIGGMQDSSRQEDAEALRAALEPLMAPVGEEDPLEGAPMPEMERFETAEGARAAAAERLAVFLEENPDSDVAPAARLAMAAVGGEAPEASVERLGQWIQEHEDLSLVTAARLVLADAQARAGSTEDAIATYRQVAEAQTGLLKAQALMAIGDLRNPLVVDGGDAAGAREAYEAAREALGPRPEAAPGDMLAASFGEPYLYGALDDRLALLQ